MGSSGFDDSGFHLPYPSSSRLVWVGPTRLRTERSAYLLPHLVRNYTSETGRDTTFMRVVEVRGSDYGDLRPDLFRREVVWEVGCLRYVCLAEISSLRSFTSTL